MTSDPAKRLRSYLKHGEIYADELLLAPEWSLKFIDDLERVHIEILGVDFWRRTPDGFLVEIPYSGDTPGASVSERAQAARNMITHNRPPEALYASIVFPAYWLLEA